MKAELLDAETETALALAWRDHRDEAALHRLITAYMRLAISMASKFKRYGAPMSDLVQEASLGLMKAADKFDPVGHATCCNAFCHALHLWAIADDYSVNPIIARNQCGNGIYPKLWAFFCCETHH